MARIRRPTARMRLLLCPGEAETRDRCLPRLPCHNQVGLRWNRPAPILLCQATGNTCHIRLTDRRWVRLAETSADGQGKYCGERPHAGKSAYHGDAAS